MVVGFMEPTTMRYEMYNAIALIEAAGSGASIARCICRSRKNHYFVPGDDVVVVECRAGRVGLSICYDMVFPDFRRARRLQGAELLCVPSNWLAIEGLERLGEVLPVARALEQQLHVVFVNGVGEALEVRGRKWHLYGGSTIVSATGKVVARASGGEEALSGFLPAGDLADAANVFPVLRDGVPMLIANLLRRALASRACSWSAAHESIRCDDNPGNACRTLAGEPCP